MTKLALAKKNVHIMGRLSVLYVVCAILKFTSSESESFCELPLVDKNSIKYEFIAEQSGTDWTLNAFVSWDAPPSDVGIGYNAYFVRFDTDRLTGKLTGVVECDIGDLYNDFEYTTDTSYLFTDIKFGYEYYFSVFVVNVDEERRTGLDSFQRTAVSLDCYNATRDMKFCQDLPIMAASSPTNPQAVCLTSTTANDMMFEAILIEWGAPVQINPDGILSNFRILLTSSNGDSLLSKKRPVTEDENVAALTTEQFTFTLNLEGFDDALSRNETYVVTIYSILQNISQFGNAISTAINTTDLPVCVEWSDWSSWTPSECCGDSINQNQNRTCEDRFRTGLTCDGLDSRNRTCECALLNPFQVGLLTCGTAIMAACLMALIWKFYVRSKDAQDEDDEETYIPDRKSKESPFSPVSNFGDKEIDREDLVVYSDMLLGSGAQGSVYKGQLRVKGKWHDVAVKTPKLEDKTSSQREIMKDTFLKEIQFSIDVQGKKGHPNILRVLGCCTLREPYYLVTPLMEYGDLLSFLRKCKKVRLMGNDILQSPYNLSPIDQLNILRHIAQGMEFVCGSRYYMGDLAASNVLLDKDLVAKLADFGLGFDLYLTTGMVRRQQDRPFQFRPRWVSLETYESNGAICNLKSDIWSFGIVMYEVYSFGEIPYSVKWSNSQLLMELKRGYRLAKPQGCPPDMYDMMLRCWEADPNQRPTFTALVKEFNQKIDALTHHKSLKDGYITVGDSDSPGQENLGLDLVDENTEITDHMEYTIKETDANEADVESDHESNLESQGDIESGEFFHHGLDGISPSDTSGPEFVSDSNIFSGDSVTDVNITSGESGRPDEYHLWANLHRNSGEPVSSEFIRIPEQNVLLNSEVVDINDYHDFKRFPDDEVKEPEKEVTL